MLYFTFDESSKKLFVRFPYYVLLVCLATIVFKVNIVNISVFLSIFGYPNKIQLKVKH